MSTNAANPLLEIRELSKHFPGVQALDQVSLRLNRGEVLAVIGENGAGKSTLMNILAGVCMPDSGMLLLDGQPVRFAGVADALRQGISLIHQELNLAAHLSIAANIFLGREPRWGGPCGFIRRKQLMQSTRTLLARVGLQKSPATLICALSPGQRQLVAIAQALSLQSRILIMDEPTSSLTQAETERLYEVVQDLKSNGVAVVYISHRLAEVQRLADRVVVLRDGRNAGELARPSIQHDAMVRLMVGRELPEFYQRQQGVAAQAKKSIFEQEYIIEIVRGQHPARPKPKPPRLEVRQVRYADGPAEPISLTIQAGEIVGMAGLVGAGRTELAEALFGIRPLTAGEILLDGQPVLIQSPQDALAAGLLLAPEDRRTHGLVLQDSVQHNLALPNLDRLNILGLVAPWREKSLARSLIQRLQVRTPSLRQPVGLLSGGNQQKVVLGKWLARRPRVLLLDEPTRGIDVGAKGEIYAWMDRLTGEGVSILMISSDLEEIIGMSDRVLVLHQGRLAGTLSREALTEEAIMHLATGGQMRAEIV